MNILHKLHQALINAGWIRGVEVREPLTMSMGYLEGAGSGTFAISDTYLDRWKEKNGFAIPEKPVTPAEMISRRLKQIAEQRAWLFQNKAELARQKKAFYRPLRDLTNEEMALETGKLIWSPEAGWIDLRIESGK